MIRESTLRILAIHCSGCASAVIRNLHALPGVSVTYVDHEAKKVLLSYDESQVSLDQIKDSLDEMGFGPYDE